MFHTTVIGSRVIHEVLVSLEVMSRTVQFTQKVFTVLFPHFVTLQLYSKMDSMLHLTTGQRP